MHNRESVGPSMKPWGTPTLTEYSSNDFLSRTTRGSLILRNDEKRLQYLARNSLRLKFLKNTSMSNPVESFIYSATAPVAQDLWQCNQFYKIQLSEDLQLIKKTWKHTGKLTRGHTSQTDQKTYYLQVFQRLY